MRCECLKATRFKGFVIDQVTAPLGALLSTSIEWGWGYPTQRQSEALEMMYVSTVALWFSLLNFILLW